MSTDFIAIVSPLSLYPFGRGLDLKEFDFNRANSWGETMAIKSETIPLLEP